MTSSNIHNKLHKIQAQLQTVDKSGTNKFSKYDYVTLADFLVPLRPFLKDYHLTLTQSVVNISSGMEFTGDGGYYSSATVLCTTVLTDVETAESITIECPGYSTDKNGDKACYKAITGARKYALSCLFALEWFSVEPEDDRFDDKAQQQAPKGGGGGNSQINRSWGNRGA